jgi:hypothetical protein
MGFGRGLKSMLDICQKYHVTHAHVVRKGVDSFVDCMPGFSQRYRTFGCFPEGGNMRVCESALSGTAPSLSDFAVLPFLLCVSCHSPGVPHLCSITWLGTVQQHMASRGFGTVQHHLASRGLAPCSITWHHVAWHRAASLANGTLLP